jgi:hypothetical protein
MWCLPNAPTARKGTSDLSILSIKPQPIQKHHIRKCRIFFEMNSLKMKQLPKKSTASNEHIAKMAALPSSEKLYYFRGGCSLRSVVEAATSASCQTLVASG